MVLGMYLLSAGDLNRTSWHGGSSGRVQAPCDLLNWSHWACLFGDQEVSDPLHIDWLRMSTCMLDSPVMQDLLW